MQKKRQGSWSRQGRTRLILLAALLLTGLVLMLKSRAGTEQLQFPLDTDRWRISDGYGWRADPFTGEPVSYTHLTLPTKQTV